MLKIPLQSMLLIAAVLVGSNAISCNLGRLGCIASCNLQNCATGYCETRGGQEICVCSRCGEGSILSIDIGFLFSFKKRSTDPAHSITIDENSGRATFCGVATGTFGNATVVVGAEATPHTSTANGDFNPTIQGIPMMFNETNRMICANVDVTDYYNIIRKEGIESFMITLYTPEREDGQPKGAELRSPELEMFIRDGSSDGNKKITASICTLFVLVFAGMFVFQ